MEDRILRDRIEEIDGAIERIEPDQGDGSLVLVGQTFQESAYPTTANAVFACNVMAISGAEVEGGSASLSSTGAVVHAANLGTAVPLVGTALILTQAGDRWVFRYDG